MNRRRKRSGFTLVELLVVIAIIGILVALLLPAVQAAREAARRMSCGNNLKQLGLALHNYHDTYKTFPPDAIWHGNLRGTTPNAMTVRNYTWIAMILPYIEQSPLYEQIDFRLPALQELNRIQVQNGPAIGLMIPALICPTDVGFNSPPRGIGITSYSGNAGWDHHRRKHRDTWRAGPFTFYDASGIKDVRDGTSNTVMLGETTLRGYCCRVNSAAPDPDRWRGGSGRLRHSNQSVSRSALIATSTHTNWNHIWVLEEQKGDVLQADGNVGPLWGVPWQSPNHIHPPTYYPHYSMNVEWPAPGSSHPGGAQFTLADASVRFSGETVSVGQAIAGGNNANNGLNGNVWFSMHSQEGHPNQTQIRFD